MKEKRGVAWKAFIVAACVIAIVSVIISVVISTRSVRVVKEEICNKNYIKLEEVRRVMCVMEAAFASDEKGQVLNVEI